MASHGANADASYMVFNCLLNLFAVMTCAQQDQAVRAWILSVPAPPAPAAWKTLEHNAVIGGQEGVARALDERRLEVPPIEGSEGNETLILNNHLLLCPAAQASVLGHRPSREPLPAMQGLASGGFKHLRFKQRTTTTANAKIITCC